MSQTRKGILTIKYIEFQAKLIEAGVNCSIFPSIEDIELSDLIMMFEIKFTDSKNYKQTCKELINYSNIKLTNDELEIIYPFIEEFIKYYFTVFKLL